MSEMNREVLKKIVDRIQEEFEKDGRQYKPGVCLTLVQKWANEAISSDYQEPDDDAEFEKLWNETFVKVYPYIQKQHALALWSFGKDYGRFAPLSKESQGQDVETCPKCGARNFENNKLCRGCRSHRFRQPWTPGGK